MSLITIVRRRLRAAAIRRLEQDIDWARASSDAHIRSLEQQLDRLRAQDRRSTADVCRDVGRREKGFA
jgi:predicted site-specific integrase-resolvase